MTHETLIADAITDCAGKVMKTDRPKADERQAVMCAVFHERGH